VLNPFPIILPIMHSDELFESHLHLASRIVSGYRNIPGLEPEDVRSVAQAALSRATHAYRPERGEFVPFANTVIRNALNTLHQQQQRRAQYLYFEADLLPDPGQETDTTTSLVERFADSSADVILQARRGEARTVLEGLLADFQERTRQVQNDSEVVIIGEKVMHCTESERVEVRLLATGESCAEKRFDHEIVQIWERTSADGLVIGALVSVPDEGAIYHHDVGCNVNRRTVHSLLRSTSGIEALSSGGEGFILAQTSSEAPYFFVHEFLESPLMRWSGQHGFPEWVLANRMNSALTFLRGGILGSVFEPHGWAASQYGNLVA